MAILEQSGVVPNLVNGILAKVHKLSLFDFGILSLHTVQEVLFGVLETFSRHQPATHATNLKMASAPVLLLHRVNLEVHALNAVVFPENLNCAKLVVEGLDERLARWTLNKLLQQVVRCDISCADIDMD